MPPTRQPSPHLIGNRIASAKVTAERVQEEIQLAEAQLHLVNQVIADKIADTISDADLAKAVAHNEAVEEKLHEAGEKLEVVTDLLTSEERDHQRMEQAARAADGTSTPGARSGAGSASVIEHLRELTRHRVTGDAPAPSPAPIVATGRKSARKTGRA